MSRHTPDHKFSDLAVSLGMVDDAGKPSAGIHDLRRTVATGLASIGTPTSLIDRIQGRNLGSDGDSGVSWVYNRHDYLRERRAALERWQEKLANIVTAQS